MIPVDPSTTIPKSLTSLSPHPESPWNFSSALYARVTAQPYESGGTSYKTCQVLPSDPEWKFIQEYFRHQKPPHFTIGNVFCIYNPTLSKAFESRIATIDERANTLKPEWNKEGLQTQRQQVINRWKEQTDVFYPVAIERPTRKDTYFNARVLPVWHGTSKKICHLISSTGFTFFGKHHFTDSNAKAGSFASTDPGYFGSGIYFTTSAAYASMYNSGNLMLGFVTMTEPFPVVNDVPHPAKGSDMQMLRAKGTYQTYNTHYIPVAPISNHPKCMEYFPCYKDQAPLCDEIVVVQESQTLPRFCVELQVDFFSTPSAPLIVPVPTTALATTTTHLVTTTVTTTTTATTPLASPIVPVATTALTTTTTHLVTTTVTTTTTATTPTTPPHLVTKTTLAPTTLTTPTQSKKSSATSLDREVELLRPLWIACENGDLTAVQSEIKSWWINKEERINKQNLSGATPLILATQKGHFSVVQCLLENKAHSDIPDSEGYHPLHWGAKIGDLKIVQLLVQKGSGVNHPGLYQRTPLHMAAHNGHAPIVAWLISVGASVNAQAGGEDNMTTPLHEAVMREHLGVVQTLMSAPQLNVNLTDSNHHTALYYAVLSGQLEMIKCITTHASWQESTHHSNPNHTSQLLKLKPAKNEAAIQAYLSSLSKVKLNKE